MNFTRRGVQVGLGLFWLLAGALQLQPYMLRHTFATQVLAPTGDGQPGWVASGVNWSADLVNAHPVLWDTSFAGIQLLLGLGLLMRPTVRLAIVASVGWALGVWYFGEGLGGLTSGHADLLTGAPGAVILYAVLGVAAWPRTRSADTDAGGSQQGDGFRSRPAGWFPIAWSVIWIGGAVLSALPGQNTASDVAGEVNGTADGAPGWLAFLIDHTSSAVSSLGVASVVLLVVVQATIGLLALRPGTTRTIAAWGGAVVALIFWTLGQGLGALYSGQSTDPNAGPLLVFMAFTLLAVAHPQPTRQTSPSQAIRRRTARQHPNIGRSMPRRA